MFEIDTHANLFCCLLIIALNLAQVRSMQVSKKQINILNIENMYSLFPFYYTGLFDSTKTCAIGFKDIS